MARSKTRSRHLQRKARRPLEIEREHQSTTASQPRRKTRGQQTTRSPVLDEIRPRQTQSRRLLRHPSLGHFLVHPDHREQSLRGLHQRSQDLLEQQHMICPPVLTMDLPNLFQRRQLQVEAAATPIDRGQTNDMAG